MEEQTSRSFTCPIRPSLFSPQFKIEDRSRNYVVQFILELKVDHVTRVVMSQLKGCFVRFSIKKYASNVIQKCLNASDDGQVNLIISKVTSKSSHFRTILQDPFGNYVA
ncbi:hypothetical protein Ancab_017004 [Ancistrocladus abbreviatus]